MFSTNLLFIFSTMDLKVFLWSTICLHLFRINLVPSRTFRLECPNLLFHYFRDFFVSFFLIFWGDWNFQHLFDLEFRETLQNFTSFSQHSEDLFSMGNKSCPNELKFCEVSRNSKSNRCWKFQLSIFLSNKKVFFQKKKKIWSVPWIVLSSTNRCRIVSQLS